MTGHRPDTVAIAIGAAVGTVGLVVVGVVASITDAGDDGPLAVALPLLAVAVAGLAAAGWVAAGRCRGAPLLHAAAAALAAVVVADGFVIARQAITDEPIAWAEATVWLLLAVAAGLTGGRRALRPRRRADSPG